MSSKKSRVIPYYRLSLGTYRKVMYGEAAYTAEKKATLTDAALTQLKRGVEEGSNVNVYRSRPATMFRSAFGKMPRGTPRRNNASNKVRSHHLEG